jgi:hypothetical protein
MLREFGLSPDKSHRFLRYLHSNSDLAKSIEIYARVIATVASKDRNISERMGNFKKRK